MKKVVILESLGIGAEELSALKRPFEEQGTEFAEYPRTTDPERLVRQAADADAARPQHAADTPCGLCHPRVHVPPGADRL